MKKTVRLTESELINVIKRIVSEQLEFSEDKLNKAGIKTVKDSDNELKYEVDILGIGKIVGSGQKAKDYAEDIANENAQDNLEVKLRDYFDWEKDIYDVKVLVNNTEKVGDNITVFKKVLVTKR